MIQDSRAGRYGKRRVSCDQNHGGKEAGSYRTSKEAVARAGRLWSDGQARPAVIFHPSSLKAVHQTKEGKRGEPPGGGGGQAGGSMSNQGKQPYPTRKNSIPWSGTASKPGKREKEGKKAGQEGRRQQRWDKTWVIRHAGRASKEVPLNHGNWSSKKC